MKRVKRFIIIIIKSKISLSVITFRDFPRRFKNENQKFLTSNILIPRPYILSRKNDAFKINESFLTYFLPPVRIASIHVSATCDVYGEDVCR